MANLFGPCPLFTLIASAYTMFAGTAWAVEYHVGPGQPHTRIGQVPWHKLRAGDTVWIHYQPEPYREKFLISSRGTASHWIRVLGVPGPNGELPAISGDGATTSSTMHHRWPAATGQSAIQGSGIVQIAPRENGPKPGFIEVANLRVQDGYSAYSFTAENGVSARYDDFCACIYSRSADHILIRNNVLTNCGLGFYNWTGSSDAELQTDTIVRANHFYGNGIAKHYSQHAVYTESDRVIIEYNRFGPMRPGALGSQIKDRSAGTVVRYNYVEQPEGWMIDMVEPENGDPALSSRPYFLSTWVYGNILLHTGIGNGPAIHWNEDHGMGKGRADMGGTLYFYHNTFAITRNEPEIWKFPLFSVHSGGWSCPTSTKGVIDARNNIWANLPRTASSPTARMFFAGCGVENFVFGPNWASPGWTLAFGRQYTGTASGVGNLLSPSANNPGFLDIKSNDIRLAPGSSARGISGKLPPEVAENTLGLSLTPAEQYVYHLRFAPRSFGAGSDAGALGGPPPPLTAATEDRSTRHH